MDNKAIRLQARSLLAYKWVNLALVWLILYAIYIVCSSFYRWSFILTFIIAGPFTLGIYNIFLKIWREEDFKIKDMFSGFKYFGKALGTYLLMTLYILLWSILFIIPGIIAAIGYSKTFLSWRKNPILNLLKL